MRNTIRRKEKKLKVRQYEKVTKERIIEMKRRAQKRFQQDLVTGWEIFMY